MLSEVTFTLGGEKKGDRALPVWVSETCNTVITLQLSWLSCFSQRNERVAELYWHREGGKKREEKPRNDHIQAWRKERTEKVIYVYKKTKSKRCSCCSGLKRTKPKQNDNLGCLL